MINNLPEYKVAVIAGDGIGREVIPAGLQILDEVARSGGFRLTWTEFDWSCETYARTGSMMPSDGIDQLRDHDAIFLGAVGFPGVPDHVSLWGLLLPIRREFDQYINFRPVRRLAGVRSPLSSSAPIDMLIVRENTEGEYSRIGGLHNKDTDFEFVLQESVFTRRGTDRVLKFAFEQARRRRSHVTSATKSNGLYHSMPYWDSRVAAVAAAYDDVVVDQYHVDSLAASFVLHPERFDVVVGSNLFGDILSDLGPACTGTIAVAPSANINPERSFPSMFEPVHGSAPDIVGQGIANPVGAIWAGALMLEHLGQVEAHDRILRAIEAVLAGGACLTPDMGGSASTLDLTREILEAL